MWARYSSAQFDQGAGRQACNNPYDKAVDDKVYADMKAKKMWTIPHSDFMNLIQPSFSGVDDMEDMNAILARTHIIVITENGVYWRVASTQHENVNFIEWPEDRPKDLLAPSQKPIFEAYKRDPHKHTLPPNFIEDSIWSQTLLKKLFNGETIPRSYTIRTPAPLFGGERQPPRQVSPRLMPESEMRIKVKKEQVDSVWKQLKRQGPLQIDLDTPSPKKKQPRASLNEEEHATEPASSRNPAKPCKPSSVPGSQNSTAVPANPDFLGDIGADNGFPAVGETEDLEQELAHILDNMDDFPDNTEIQPSDEPSLSPAMEPSEEQAQLLGKVSEGVPNPPNEPAQLLGTDSEDVQSHSRDVPHPPVEPAPSRNSPSLNVDDDMDVVESESAEGGTSELDAFQDVCGVKVLQWLGIPVPHTCNGPFKVSDLNGMIKPFGVKLTHVHKVRVSCSGKFLCHAQGHFTGIKLVEGFVIEYDNDVLTHLSMGGLYDYLQQEGRTIFALQKVNHHDLITSPDFDPTGGSTRGVMKRPASIAPIPPAVPRYLCPLTQCTCPGCEGNLIHKRFVNAICYDLNGPVSVLHEQKVCTSRNCRTSYGHNYKWENGKKINTIGIQQLGNSVLFVNSKKAFTLNFLKYHEELMFRGHVSALAVEHAYFATHSPHMSSENDIIVDFRKLYHTGLFYYLALKEFQPLDRHLSIVIDDEVPDNTIELYDAYCHGTLFPPMNKQKVKIVVGDGNMRLNMLCQEGPKRRTGRPRAGRASVGKHANGWFMVCDPSTGKILGLRVMKEPENTQHVLQMLDAVVWLYPKLNTFVYDRACSIVRAAHEEDSLGQIEHYIVDWFHAYRHNSKCKCNPSASSVSELFAF